MSQFRIVVSSPAIEVEGINSYEAVMNYYSNPANWGDLINVSNEDTGLIEQYYTFRGNSNNVARVYRMKPQQSQYVGTVTI